MFPPVTDLQGRSHGLDIPSMLRAFHHSLLQYRKLTFSFPRTFRLATVSSS